MFKSLLNVCNSIKTTNLLLWLLIVLFTAGALFMPGNKSFDSIQDARLFQWLGETPFYSDWWILGSIIVMVLLVINTVSCSVNSLIKKKERRNWLLTIAPQVVHTGFCFIMLAHFLSASGSTRENGIFYEGSALKLGSGIDVLIKKITYKVEYGRPVDPAARVQIVFRDGRTRDAAISLNNPLFLDGTGVYLKNISFNRGVTVLLEVAKDPGALWALLGSILFSFGTALFFLLKIKYKVSD